MSRVDARAASTKSYGATSARRRRRRPARPARLAHRRARPVGLRQDDAAAAGRRVPGAPTRARSRFGEPLVAGHGVRHVPPQQRRVGYVPQEGALFPHLDVAANIAFGLPRARERRLRPRRRDARPRRAARRRPRPAPRTSCPAASSSAWHWPGRSRRSPPSCSSTSRSPRSTPACAPAPAAPSPRPRRPPNPPPCWSPTTRTRRSRSPTRSPSCAPAGWSRSATPREVYRAPGDPQVAEFVGGAVVLPGTVTDARATCALGEVRLPSRPRGPVALLIRPEQVCSTSPTTSGVRGTGRGGQLLRARLRRAARLRRRHLGPRADGRACATRAPATPSTCASPARSGPTTRRAAGTLTSPRARTRAPHARPGTRVAPAAGRSSTSRASATAPAVSPATGRSPTPTSPGASPTARPRSGPPAGSCSSTAPTTSTRSSPTSPRCQHGHVALRRPRRPTRPARRDHRGLRPRRGLRGRRRATTYAAPASRPRPAPRPRAAAEHVRLHRLTQARPALARQPRAATPRPSPTTSASPPTTAPPPRCRCTTATACRCCNSHLLGRRERRAHRPVGRRRVLLGPVRRAPGRPRSPASRYTFELLDRSRLRGPRPADAAPGHPGRRPARRRSDVRRWSRSGAAAAGTSS